MVENIEEVEVMEVVEEPAKPQEADQFKKTEALAKYESEVPTLTAPALQLVITSEEDDAKANTMLGVVREKQKQLQKNLKEDISFPNAYIKWVREKYAIPSQMLEKAEEAILKAIGDWRAKLREEQERKQAEENAKALEALNKSPDASPLPVANPVKVQGGPAKTVDSGEFKVSYRTDWYAEVVNPDEVPREWCDPNLLRLNKYADLMKEKASVPGVAFHSKEVPYTRRTKS